MNRPRRPRNFDFDQIKSHSEKLELRARHEYLLDCRKEYEHASQYSLEYDILDQPIQSRAAFKRIVESHRRSFLGKIDREIDYVRALLEQPAVTVKRRGRPRSTGKPDRLNSISDLEKTVRKILMSNRDALITHQTLLEAKGHSKATTNRILREEDYPNLDAFVEQVRTEVRGQKRRVPRITKIG